MKINRQQSRDVSYRDKKIKRWRKELEEITKDITVSLIENKHIFDEFQGIIRKNEKIGFNNSFYNLWIYNYVSSVVLSICRLTDRDEKSLSLYNLLEDVLLNSDIITREWFMSECTRRCKRKDFMKDQIMAYAIDNFDKKFAGRIKFFLDPSVVQSDIRLLFSKTKEVRRFRNKVVAHKDKKKFKMELRIVDVNIAINTIEKIVLKYQFLLNQAGYPSRGLLPQGIDGWKEIFRVPWIEK